MRRLVLMCGTAVVRARRSPPCGSDGSNPEARRVVDDDVEHVDDHGAGGRGHHGLDGRDRVVEGAGTGAVREGPRAGGRGSRRAPPRARTPPRSARSRSRRCARVSRLVVVLTETGGADPAVVSTETEITLEPRRRGVGGQRGPTALDVLRAPVARRRRRCSPIELSAGAPPVRRGPCRASRSWFACHPSTSSMWRYAASTASWEIVTGPGRDLAQVDDRRRAAWGPYSAPAGRPIASTQRRRRHA